MVGRSQLAQSPRSSPHVSTLQIPRHFAFNKPDSKTKSGDVSPPQAQYKVALMHDSFVTNLS